MKEELGLKILELRNQGKTYKEIASILGCAKSTVAYWCGNNQKQKTRERCLRQERWKRQLIKNISDFKTRQKSSNIRKSKDWNSKLRSAVKDFCKRSNMENWGYKELINKFGTKTKCYLTGRDIDITKDDYNLDHIIPVSKGGDGSLENVGITISIANASKTNMTLEEYLDLCEEVLRYHKPDLFK